MLNCLMYASCVSKLLKKIQADMILSLLRKFVFVIIFSGAIKCSDIGWFHKKLQGSRYGRFVLKRLGVSSHAFGWLARSYLSRFFIKTFIDKCAKEGCPIKLDQFNDLSSFASFRDFFVRKFKNNRLRPFAGSAHNSFCAPVEGMYTFINDVSNTESFFVKSSQFTLERFLGAVFSKISDRPRSMIIARLRIGDYHRIHMPINGFIREIHDINGSLLSVRPGAFTEHQNPLIENSRKVLFCESFDNQPFVMVAVGAFFIGSIVIDAAKNSFLLKGQDIGFFEPGGSTVVLVIPKQSFFTNASINQYTQFPEELMILLGSEIGLLGK